MLCQDASTEEIADALVLSSETVRSHVKNILRKLRVGSRQQAVEAARRMRSDIIVTEPAAA
jgi:LuxR family maltose regulon positive regulatory protein